MWPFSKAVPDLEKLAMTDHPDVALLAGQRLLETVGVLHRRGYEGLRICPHRAPSGADWRCFVVPRGRMRTACELDMESWRELEPKATFSTAHGWEPFGWKGVATRPAAKWADRFLQEFATTCLEGQLADPAYAAWYRDMLAQMTKLRNLPIAWDDYEVYDPLRLFQGAGTFPTPAQP